MKENSNSRDLIVKHWIIGFKNEMDGNYNSLMTVFKSYGSPKGKSPFDVFAKTEIWEILEDRNSSEPQNKSILYMKDDIMGNGEILKAYLFIIDDEKYFRLKLDFEHWIIGNYYNGLLEDHIEELNRFYPEWEYYLIPSHCKYYQHIHN